MTKRLLRDKKGVAILEVVIAMAIIAICGASILTMIVVAIKGDIMYRNRYDVLMTTESAIECIRFSEGDEGVLKKGLVQLDFKDTNGNEIKDLEEDEFPADGIYVYQKGDDYKAEICVEADKIVVKLTKPTGTEEVYTYKK